MVEFVKLAEKMIAAEHSLPSKQGFYCGGCPHKGACKAWHRQAVDAAAKTPGTAGLAMHLKTTDFRIAISECRRVGRTMARLPS